MGLAISRRPSAASGTTTPLEIKFSKIFAKVDAPGTFIVNVNVINFT